MQPFFISRGNKGRKWRIISGEKMKAKPIYQMTADPPIQCILD